MEGFKYNYTNKEKAMEEIDAFTREVQNKAVYRVIMEELGITIYN